MKILKSFVLPLSILLLAGNLFAQGNLSPFTKIFLKRTKAGLSKPGATYDNVFTKKMKEDYLVKYSKTGYSVHGILTVGPDMNEADLNRYGITVNTKISNFWTVQLPVKSFNSLKNIKGLKYVQIDSPVRTRLDSTRKSIGADLLHSGTGLSRQYKGNGVIVGIIDSGFDLLHPAFMDASGNTRITRVWDQNADSGNPPSGYSYGAEISGAANIAAYQYTIGADQESHGSHVAGIAAGSGLNTSGKYTGIAPEAELVLIGMGGGSAIIDGINYIFSYAASVGKPAVINMSLGSHIGPHDGTSSFDQSLDGLAGSGKILVGAAGNEGSTPLHLEANLSGDTVKTFVGFESYEIQGEGLIDIWGSPGSEIFVSVSSMGQDYSFQQGIFYSSTANETGIDEYKLITGTDTVAFYIECTAANFNNNKPNILIYITNTSSRYPVISITSSSSTVHVWNHGTGYGAPLESLAMSGFAEGNNEITIGEIGATSNSIIAVGAYVTRKRWTDVNSQSWVSGEDLFDIASFSSRGPTADGRLKPEITAPGCYTASSASSFDENYSTPGQTTMFQDSQGGRTFPYELMQGTSMAAPALAGVVALMLEANSDLSKEDIVNIFKQTGKSDGFTGSNLGAGNNNTWGFGKVDAYQAVISAAASATSVEEITNNTIEKYELQNNYPNPFNPLTNIRFSIKKAGMVKVSVFNTLGQTVKNLSNEYLPAGTFKVSWDGKNETGQPVSSGMYIYRIETKGFTSSKKMLLLK